MNHFFLWFVCVGILIWYNHVDVIRSGWNVPFSIKENRDRTSAMDPRCQGRGFWGASPFPWQPGVYLPERLAEDKARWSRISESLCFSLFVVIWLTAYCILSYILSTSNTFSPTRTRENERWSVCVQEVREELLERLTTTEGTISCGFQLGQDRSNVHITSGCISSAKTSMYNLIQKWFWLHHWHHSARILLRFSWKCSVKLLLPVKTCRNRFSMFCWSWKQCLMPGLEVKL